MPDLSLLPSGTSVFVDTNIFDLHFQGKSITCTNFLDRIAKHDIDAYVNTQVLSDLLHKLMTAEAYAKHCISKRSAFKLRDYLKNNRGKPIPLGDYQNQFEKILSFDLNVLPIDEKLLVETKIERSKFYLMTGDSIHLGCMNRRTLKQQNVPLLHIVTHDSDFEHIPALTVWEPTDVDRTP